MESSNENTEGVMSDNSSYNDASILSLRLDTSPILNEIKHDLAGTKEIYKYTAEGEPRLVVEQVAPPKMNEAGIHGIMSWLNQLLNSQMVQGNTQSFDHLNNKMAYLRQDLNDDMMNNFYKWELSLSSFEGIADKIVTSLKIFLSRTVNNAERNSFTHTMKHTESNTNNIRQSGKMNFGLPGFGR